MPLEISNSLFAAGLISPYETVFLAIQEDARDCPRIPAGDEGC